MKSVGILLLSLIFLSTSCKKDEDKNPTKKDLLTAHDWKRTAMIINGNYIASQDCELDDIVSFWSTGEYRYKVAGVLCFPTQTGQNATWSLSADESTLTLNSAQYTLEVTSDSMKYSANGYSFIHAAIK